MSIRGVNGEELKSTGARTSGWSGELPLTQDYFIAVSSANGGALDYMLQVAIRPNRLWWAADMSQFSVDDKSGWQWMAMIMQPDYNVADLVEMARAQVARQKKLPALPRLRLETLCNGQAAQMMHLGPYAAEASTIEKLHQFIAAQGGQHTGKRHEIYLNDPTRTAPEKLKTVIRRPFAWNSRYLA